MAGIDNPNRSSETERILQEVGADFNALFKEAVMSNTVKETTYWVVIPYTLNNAVYNLVIEPVEGNLNMLEVEVVTVLNQGTAIATNSIRTIISWETLGEVQVAIGTILDKVSWKYIPTSGGKNLWGRDHEITIAPKVEEAYAILKNKTVSPDRFYTAEQVQHSVNEHAGSIVQMEYSWNGIKYTLSFLKVWENGYECYITTFDTLNTNFKYAFTAVNQQEFGERAGAILNLEVGPSRKSVPQKAVISYEALQKQWVINWENPDTMVAENGE